MSQTEVDDYVAKHGCFCGGDGEFTDYSCGTSFLVTCPHCCGSGIKRCACQQPTLRCPGKPR